MYFLSSDDGLLLMNFDSFAHRIMRLTIDVIPPRSFSPTSVPVILDWCH